MVQILTIVVLARNHQEFIGETLESVAREFGPHLTVVFVDTGSSDATRSVAYSTAHRLGIPLKCVEGDFTTVQALSAVDPFISTPYVMLISGDDFLLPGYGRKSAALLHEIDHMVCLNFELLVGDRQGCVTGTSRPLWVKSRVLNRILMAFTNPGRAPGSIVPWTMIRKSGLLHRHSECLVDDYIIWSYLVRECRFKNVPGSFVFYRRHPSAQGFQKRSDRYAWSLGYAAGVARRVAVPALFRPIHMLVVWRWSRKFDSHRRRSFRTGFVLGEGSVSR